MLNEKLNVGDYIFTASGRLGRIIKINKQTYTYVNLQYGTTDNVYFNGTKKNWDGIIEFFKCDEPQAKALELMIAKYQKADKLEDIKKEIKELLGKAKTCLNQIADIEEVEEE